MLDTGNLANYPGRAPEALGLRRASTSATLNLPLFPQISVGTTPQKKPVYSKWRPPEKTTAGRNAETRWLWGASPQRYIDNTAPAPKFQRTSWKREKGDYKRQRTTSCYFNFNFCEFLLPHHQYEFLASQILLWYKLCLHLMKGLLVFL